MENNTQSYHMAAIIPVAGQPLDFNMPWDDCLMPIAADYHLIERAVHTAAMSGCHTIWLVCYREMQPIIKKKLGNWVYDPVHVWGDMPFMTKREVPIYYVGINPKDRKRRDSQAWSALYGARVAYQTSKKISMWLTPSKFLVISPYGIINEDALRQRRVDMAVNNREFLFTHNNQTFLDNSHLPFTFNPDQYNLCNRHFKDIYSGCDTDKTFADVFNPIEITNYLKFDAGWFYKVTDWTSYHNFLCSPEAKGLARPKYMVTHKWRGFVKDR